ncbi:MAG TPA: hypothetical protein VHV30_07045 [Polyangiaceae bacterium]|nr:hypothetical protein [Polyangiaceae bacterium]
MPRPLPPSSAAPDPLDRAFDAAVAGKPTALYELLARGSKLPGPRINEALADAFAATARARGAKGDALVLAMTNLDADEAPGATPLEFLPVCGVLALASRAAADEKVRGKVLPVIHGRADDLRFRVREAVVDALVKIGSVAGDALVHDVAPWMDGYFHAAAVLRGLSTEAWLSKVHDVGAVVQRMDEAFQLALNAPRSAARYPGHKALLEALQAAPVPVIVRFGVPVFDLLTRWAEVKDPVLRALVAASIGEEGGKSQGKRQRESKLAGRFRPEVDRVVRVLDATAPLPRNPDHDFGPSRDRSGERRSGRRKR